MMLLLYPSPFSMWNSFFLFYHLNNSYLYRDLSNHRSIYRLFFYRLFFHHHTRNGLAIPEYYYNYDSFDSLPLHDAYS